MDVKVLEPPAGLCWKCGKEPGVWQLTWKRAGAPQLREYCDACLPVNLRYLAARAELAHRATELDRAISSMDWTKA